MSARARGVMARRPAARALGANLADRQRHRPALLRAGGRRLPLDLDQHVVGQLAVGVPVVLHLVQLLRLRLPRRPLWA